MICGRVQTSGADTGFRPIDSTEQYSFGCASIPNNPFTYTDRPTATTTMNQVEVPTSYELRKAREIILVVC